jgi:FlaA1/EpsC-like NDP-sugar epimerase
MVGGEIFVKKIPTMKIIDLAKAIDSKREIKIVGIRPGEKLHEQMISAEDAAYTYEYKGHYKILPSIHEWNNDPIRVKDGKLVKPDFVYSSENNKYILSEDEFKNWLKKNPQI